MTGLYRVAGRRDSGQGAPKRKTQKESNQYMSDKNQKRKQTAEQRGRKFSEKQIAEPDRVQRQPGQKKRQRAETKYRDRDMGNSQRETQEVEKLEKTKTN